MTGHFRPMEPNRYPRPINRRPEANRRLDSWKEIAAFLDCGERTVKRWETERGLPVRSDARQRTGAGIRLYRRTEPMVGGRRARPSAQRGSSAGARSARITGRRIIKK